MLTIKKCFTIGFIAVIILSLSGCKKDDNPVSSDGSLTGTWVLTNITANTSSGTITLTADQANVHLTVKIKSDNSYEMIIAQSSGTTNDTGTFSNANGSITFTSQDGTKQVWTYTISGSTLTAKTTMDLSAYTTYGLSAQTPVTLVFNKQ